MLRRFLSNHVLANLLFVLVLVVGLVSYLSMPRSQDPEINFNWINIITVLPGASANDVEKRVTDPLEESIRRSVSDIDFVSSTSREGIAIILVRFNELDTRTFDKRVSDLRRAVSNTYTDELPEEASSPNVVEITSSSGFPTATVILTAEGFNQDILRSARNIGKELELLDGVDTADSLGLYDPELLIEFFPDRIAGLGINPSDLSDTLRSYFRDVSVGDIDTVDGTWVVRLEGTTPNPNTVANFPVNTAQGVVPLSNLADVYLTTEEARQLVRVNNKPAVMFSIVKQGDANVIELVDELNTYIDSKNQLTEVTGIELMLADDQTVPTKAAISLMRNNMLIGLLLVLLVTWLFLGIQVSFFTSIGIPFTLAGTFIILNMMGMTLNTSVLLGVVIALGMLVDDAVVVVEAIYQRLQLGEKPIDAVMHALSEVFAPVTTSVLTTMAAFLPLMLLPGILGDFMMVIPLTVSIALAISLVEAYWMLPSHISAAKVKINNQHPIQKKRTQVTRNIRIRYTRLLIKSMRRPLITSLSIIGIIVIGFGSAVFGGIKFDFFSSDAKRLFYVSIEMPSTATLRDTMTEVERLREQAEATLAPNEVRSMLSFSGQMFTQTEPLFGDNLGQIMVSLNPKEKDGRYVEAISKAVMDAVLSSNSPAKITLLQTSGGPPVQSPISVKVVGNDFDEINAATEALIDFMEADEQYNNVTKDYRPGKPELQLRHKGEAIKRTGLNPDQVTRALQAYVDGELITQFQDAGYETNVRLKAKSQIENIDQLLRETISLPNGNTVALGDLVELNYSFSQQNIRHYNFQRTITVESDIDKTLTDTRLANAALVEYWETIQDNHPTIKLDFSGQLDDVEESMNAMLFLFIFGVGLIYLILGTQFQSYFQPFMVLLSIPLALTGVIFGLLITGNPLSLYTLYGVVALIGISVNSAIVLISAANSRMDAGMSIQHAIIYAARRRVVPIMITSATTIAGLFSLAAGLAGRSLMWGPVATAIVSGLAVSSILTLFVIPMVYRVVMRGSWTAFWRWLCRINKAIFDTLFGRLYQ